MNGFPRAWAKEMPEGGKIVRGVAVNWPTVFALGGMWFTRIRYKPREGEQSHRQRYVKRLVPIVRAMYTKLRGGLARK